MSTRQALAVALLVPLWRVLGAAAGTRILMYHAIGAAVPGDAQGRYSLAPERFAAQMAALAASKRRVVPLEHAAGDDVVITFDDGYSDNLTHALPVLERFGLPFTVFVTSGFARRAASPYLTAAEVRTLAAHPLARIGAHGDSHQRLTACGDHALAAELTGAKAWLEDAAGVAVNTLSYPHGAVDARVRAAVAAVGYTRACTSEFGANGPERDALALRRLDIWSSDAVTTFDAKLSGEWDWMRFFTRSGL